MILRGDKITEIILPCEAYQCEIFAAEELAKYLKLSFRITAQIKTYIEEITEGALHFLIGGPARNKYAGQLISVADFEELVTGPEGMCICVKDDTVLIAGSEDSDGYNRGALYATYEFLERYVGCCFGAYSKLGVSAGEIVPQHQQLEINDTTYIKSNSDLQYRTAIVQFNNWAGNADHTLTPVFIDWLAKNRYNRVLTWVSVYETMKKLGYLSECEKRGIRFSVGHHESIKTWFPPYGNAYFPTAYAKEHPEFYRLCEDGSRFLPKDEKDYNGQLLLCCRNPQVVDEISKNVNQWIDENPLVDMIPFWPNDGKEPQCCCDECSKYSKMENYLYFENEIAKRVTAVHPNVKIDVLVYLDLWECPENIVLSDGVVIDQSTWAKFGLRTCGKPDGSCLIGTEYEKNLLSYRDKCKNLVFYEYYMGHYGNRQRLMPSADELQSLYRHYMEVGINGSGTQIECFNIWNNLLNFYAFARTAYDTSISLEDLIRTITRLFGKGAEEMAEILRLYEETMDGQVSIRESGVYFAKQVDSERIYSLYEKALSKADEPVSRNNIRLMRMVFRYSMLSVEDKTEDVKTYAAQYIDPTGELTYMSTVFDSCWQTTGGYAISIPTANKLADVPQRDDKWYEFE